MTFLHGEDEKKHVILLKTTFETPLLLLKEVSEQAAGFDYYKYGYFLHDQQMRPSKSVTSCGHIYC